MNALPMTRFATDFSSARSLRERIRSILRITRRVGRTSHALRTHLRRHLHQPLPRHPQIRQRKERDELRCVLRQSAVSHLREAELALDHPKRMWAAPALPDTPGSYTATIFSSNCTGLR